MMAKAPPSEQQAAPPIRRQTEGLQEAIRTLESFSSRRIPSSLTSLPIKVLTSASSIRHEVREVCRLFTYAFSDRKWREEHRKSREEHEKLLRAIDVVKNHCSLLPRFCQGSPSERSLAENTLAVIHRFNAAIQTRCAPVTSLTGKIARYFLPATYWQDHEDLSYYKIPLPPVVAIGAQPSQSDKKSAPQAIFLNALRQVPTVREGPSKQEADAFRVKAISLVSSQEGSLHTIREAMHCIREAPITPAEDGSSPFENTLTSSVVSFSQTLMPFPGEILEFEGSFQHNRASQVRSVPLPRSFRLSMSSTQTGFPYPSQRHGWALPGKLMPQYPHRPQQLPLVGRLLRQQEEVAQDLLPGGKLLARAKQLLNLKKSAFDGSAPRLLALHSDLWQAMATSWAKETRALTSSMEQTARGFFHAVGQTTSPYAHLSLTYQTAAELFVSRPYNTLNDEWLAKGNQNLWDGEPSVRCAAAKAILETALCQADDELLHLSQENLTPLGLTTIDFLIAHGNLLKAAACSLILQQMSEKLRFIPPLLNPWEKSLQAALFNQLQDFFHELDDGGLPAPSLEQVQKQLAETLAKDIAFFRSGNADIAAYERVDEIEGYYRQRSLGGVDFGDEASFL